MAWNQAATPFMFATGSHDGAVRIWTTPSAATSPTAFPGLQIQGQRSEGPGGSTDGVSVNVVPTTPTRDQRDGLPRRDSYSYYRDGYGYPHHTPTHARRASLLAETYTSQSQQMRGRSPRSASVTPPAGKYSAELRLERTESPAGEQDEGEEGGVQRVESRAMEKRAVVFMGDMRRDSD